MKKDDYRAEFEEHRKKIKLDDKTAIGTRAELHKKNRKTKKQSRFSMINITLALFTLIPIIIIVFVFINIYASKEGPLAEENSSPFKYETSGKKASGKDDNLLLAEKEDREKEIEKEKEQKEQKEQEEKKKKEEEEKQKQEKEKKEQEEKEKRELAEREKIEMEERQKKELAKKDKAEQKAEPKPQSKVHVVGQNDTIYSISVAYYGSGENVDQIKQANGITSNEIFIGQKLIIP